MIYRYGRSLVFATFATFATFAMALSCNLASATPATSTGLVIQNPEGAGESFPTGVYIYYDSQGNRWNSVTLRSHFRYLASQGINIVNVTAVSLPDRNDITVLDIAKEFNIQVIHQIDNAYLTEGGNPSSVSLLDNAENAIEANINNSNLFAFSVREEPPQALIPNLFTYYQNIQNRVGSQSNIPFYLLHNTQAAIDSIFNSYYQDSNLPELTGVDSYPFGWDYTSDVGYIATPAKAFLLLRDRMSSFNAKANRPRQTFYSVITSNTQRVTHTLPELQGKSLCAAPVTVTNCERYKRWIDLAGADNQGLKYITDSVNGDSVKSWRYYRPPQGAMSAQAWLSVANEAQGVMAWSANPLSVNSSIVGMFDANGQPHRSFDELAKFGRDLKPFGKIINQMQRQASSDSLVTVSTPANPSLANKIVTRAYSVPSNPGKIFVLVNTFVGTWAANSVEFLTKTPPYQDFRIDESGELIGSDFTPATSLSVNTAASSQIFDLQTGTALTDHNSDGVPDIDVNPGSGRLLYVGQASDLNALRAQAGITTTFPIVGNSLLNADQRALVDRRLVAPANPLINSSDYNFYSHDIELNKRYKLDVTISTDSSGGAFGAVAVGYDAAWQELPGETHQINLWNKTALSPTQFTSNEFIISNPNVVHARIIFYRSNQQGTVKVLDAWLQSLDNEFRQTAYYQSKVLTDPSKTYRAVINARALPGETTTLGFKWYNCATSDCSNPTFGGDLVTWNTPLSSQNQLFQSATFKANPNAVRVLLVIYKANNATHPNNTLVVERASVWATD